MKYGLIGEHLGHSYSKIIHETWGGYPYTLMEMDRAQLDVFLKERNFSAVNVTIPYKQTVIPYLDQLEPAAEKIKAVNTIIQHEGRLIGANTDYDGFIQMLIMNQIEVTGKKVLVLGNGGAAQAVCAALGDLQAGSIIKVKRNPSAETILYETCYRDHSDAQVIVNTSPVGMFPDIQNCPIDLDRFDRLESVADVIYNPLKTQLLIAAEEKGCQIASGMGMLVAQAAKAMEYFIHRSVKEEEIRHMTEQLIQQKQNLALIGMPGSGKTTISRRLAKECGMEWVELDDWIVERIGMPIREFFVQYGEEKFRDIETAVVWEAAKKTHCILSCGGGIIKRKENIRALKANSRILFLDRPTEKLAVSASRPLSPDREHVRKLYEERIAAYRQYSDGIVKNDGSLSEAIQACRQWLEKEKEDKSR